MDGTLMGNGLRAAWRIAVQCMHPLPNWINAAATAGSGKEGRRENMLSTIRYLPISSTLALPRALHKQGVNNA